MHDLLLCNSRRLLWTTSNGNLTSNKVCRKSLASVEVSWRIRCWSSRSFCHESSSLVFIPAIFVRPELISRSSSNSFSFDCISDILISDTLFSDTSSVLNLLVSSRASHSSSSRQPICCSKATIFDLSSSSPLFIDALLIRPLLFLRSPIVFCAASNSCLNVSRSRLKRSHCLYEMKSCSESSLINEV